MMQITVTIQLQTTPEQHSMLLETLQVCNAACNHISHIAWETQTFRKYDLHHKTYHSVKTETNLHANHVVRAVAKVAHAYAADRDSKRKFCPLGAIELDDKLIRWHTKDQIVHITTSRGRNSFVFRCSANQKSLLDAKRSQCSLLLRDNQFYLAVAVEVQETELFAPQGVIGVDFGITNIATDSEGNNYTGASVMRVRRKYRRLRQILQPKKTRSARKKLQKIRHKESRFSKNENHCISKKLVQLAVVRQKALAIETLTGIRQRGNGLNRAVRTEVNNWAFYQLKTFLTYKAKRAGVTLIEVDPRYSSQTCSRCGHCERANRKTQERFECLCCGFQANADFNAALNLKARGEL